MPCRFWDYRYCFLLWKSSLPPSPQSCKEYSVIQLSQAHMLISIFLKGYNKITHLPEISQKTEIMQKLQEYAVMGRGLSSASPDNAATPHKQNCQHWQFFTFHCSDATYLCFISLSPQLLLTMNREKNGTLPQPYQISGYFEASSH